MKKISFLIVLIGFFSVLSSAQDIHPVASAAKISFDYCYKTFGDAMVVKTNTEPSVDHPYILNYMYGTEPLSQELTASGEQTVVFTKADGCDHEVNVNLVVETTPLGALNSNAVFSVSATQQVYFSQGNLQYQGSTNTYRFAENQWDLLNKSLSYVSATWLDKFPYGTSGAKYEPSKLQSYTNYPCTQGDNSQYPNQDIAGTIYDWGIYNNIMVGDEVAEKGNWRSLTQAQFQYMVETRPKATEKRGYAKVHDVYGLVLLPDNWMWPITEISMSTNSNTTKKWTNFPTISDADWALMEANGAVFLPVTTSSTSIDGYILGTREASTREYGVLMGYLSSAATWVFNYNGHYSYTYGYFSYKQTYLVRLVCYK